MWRRSLRSRQSPWQGCDPTHGGGSGQPRLDSAASWNGCCKSSTRSTTASALCGTAGWGSAPRSAARCWRGARRRHRLADAARRRARAAGCQRARHCRRRRDAQDRAAARLRLRAPDQRRLHAAPKSFKMRPWHTTPAAPIVCRRFRWRLLGCLRRTSPAAAPCERCGRLADRPISRPARAPRSPPGKMAVVQYTGWLYEAAAQDHKGKQFDSSRKRRTAVPLPGGHRSGHQGLGSRRGRA